jgi:anti-sigma regulatory factor (Ser/Thr protein kinase)
LVRAALSQIKELGAAREDAILVASELVTNAVVHSGGSPADTIQVRTVLVRGDVSISVHDPGLSDDTPHLRDANVLQASGHGLRIVKQLARRWGFERDCGYRVWAELATGRGE